MQKQIIVNENEHITVPVMWTGKGTELSYEILLAERGAQCTLYGLLLGRHNDNLQLNTTVYHNAPETKSNILIRGAVTDIAKINFEGLVKINPGAKQANAKLAAHILLLSDQAKGRAIPGLEILENDVKAAHATTVGKVDEIQLFYLMSRGLSKVQAKQLIIEGFLLDLVEKLPQKYHGSIKKELHAYAH